MDEKYNEWLDQQNQTDYQALEQYLSDEGLNELLTNN